MDKVKKYAKYGAIAFAVIGLIMTAFTFIQTEVMSFTGLQTIFGYSVGKESILPFNFMCFLTVILPLIGSLSVLCKNKTVRIVGTVLMLVGVVFCFIIPNFVVFGGEFTAAKAGFGLGAGAILAAISFLLGTACCAYSVIEK